MKRYLLLGVSVVLCLTLFLLSTEEDTAAEEDTTSVATHKTILIQNVNIVPMTHETILQKRSVLITDGVLEYIGTDDKYQIETADIVIDGSGQYLAPGLQDLHTHLDFMLDRSEPIGQHELKIFLSFGVTTILNQGEFAIPLGDGIEQLKQAIDSGSIPGPKLYTASYVRSPGMGTRLQTVTNKKEAGELVQASKAAGYEVMKVYHGISVESYEGVLEAAEKLNMPVIGHPLMALPLEKTLAMGLDLIAHAESFTYSYFNNEIQYDKIPDAVKTYLKYKPVIATTMVLEEKVSKLWGGDPTVFEHFISGPNMEFVHPTVIDDWRATVLDRWTGGDMDELNKINPFIQTYFKALHAAGAKFVMGTDGPNVIGVPGYGVHEELQYLTSLGLSPFEAIKIATKNAGEFLDEHQLSKIKSGTIEIGNKADLILIKSNPLNDVRNLLQISTVIAGNRLYDEKSIMMMKQQVSEYNANW